MATIEANNRVSPTQLAELIAVLAPNELKLFEQEIIDSRPPWEQGANIKPEKIDNCPEQVTITLANHIYFKLDELPALTARLRRLASFSNPLFFKTQAMRFQPIRSPDILPAPTLSKVIYLYRVAALMRH